MSAVQEPPVETPEGAGDDPRDVSAALAEMRHDIREQGRSIRTAQQAFAIFAVMGLLLAMVTMLAVVFKLDRKPKTVAASAAPVARTVAPATPLTRNVDVTLAQFAVSPSVTAAGSGRVTFRVHNAGTITHEFVVLRTKALASDLPLKAGRADESGNVGETGDLKAGATKSVTIPLTPGHYALICNLPGHYLAGQHADFTVR